METFVICLTPGQAARNRGGARSDEELSLMRREEFLHSCKLLEVSHGEVLDYSDGRLDRTDFYAMTAHITRRVREIKPHVMITFGPDGSITAHPDHSVVSLVATAAFHWAVRTNRFTDQLDQGLRPWAAQKLYYSTWPGTLPDRQPVALSPYSATIEVGEFLKIKLAAFKANTTQNPLYDQFERNVSSFGARELFHLAAWNKPGMIMQESDLFAGVVEQG
jgi:LmbE family N-acetylglucosaminyl deacetylase